MERRLAAILAADVVGYTRLMGADEAQAAGRSPCRRQDQLIVGLVESHPKAPEEAHSEQPSLRQTRVHDERHRDVMSDHIADP